MSRKDRDIVSNYGRWTARRMCSVRRLHCWWPSQTFMSIIHCRPFQEKFFL